MDGDDPQEGQGLLLQFEWLHRLLLHIRRAARKRGGGKEGGINLAAVIDPLRMIEHPFELRIDFVAQLPRPGRVLALSRQDHAVLRQSHDLVGIDQIAAGDMLGRGVLPAQIAALERKVGQLTMKLDLVAKPPRQPIASDSGNLSIITGPRPALSDGGAK
ncbi:hypothetical protein [Neorhizobium sp. LjRoot104]|uniref:hypothetical protein n=1 Tax=Neorhizobium sp. LjRoot104 TaxID=3342254 RepID=UPI003ED13512